MRDRDVRFEIGLPLVERERGERDVGPPIVRRDPMRRLERRASKPGAGEGMGSPVPPDGALWSFHLAQLVWQVAAQRRQTNQTVDYYRSLYRPDAAA